MGPTCPPEHARMPTSPLPQDASGQTPLPGYWGGGKGASCDMPKVTQSSDHQNVLQLPNWTNGHLEHETRGKRARRNRDKLEGPGPLPDVLVPGKALAEGSGDLFTHAGKREEPTPEEEKERKEEWNTPLWSWGILYSLLRTPAKPGDVPPSSRASPAEATGSLLLAFPRSPSFSVRVGHHHRSSSSSRAGNPAQTPKPPTN